ncbi:MAG: LysR family transcriptional regulator [Desulfosporosinus sp.]|nr:LysR family transcriptional regulator [Desulfosporosinus sp.]
MDIQLFRTFLLVAKLGSITSAAEQLNFTQPAISSQIRTLEGHFAVSLFERVGKKLYITNAGRELVNHAERLMAAYDDMHVSLHTFSVSVDPIKLGSSTAMVSYILSPIMQKFQQSGIKGTLIVDTCTFLSDTIKGLLDNTFDLVIVHNQVDNNHILQFDLSQERLVWVVQRNLVTKNDGCLDMCHYPFMNYRPGSVYRSKYEAILKDLNIKPSIECSDASSIMRAVLDGLGVGVLPYVLVAPFLNDGTLIEFASAPQLTFTISIAFRKNKVLSPAIRALLSIFAEHASIDSGLAEYLEFN